MKHWLDVVGRALIEFLLILVLIALVGGLGASLGPGPKDASAILRDSARAAIGYMPLALAASLFLSMFSFDRRLANRAAGWLGLLTIGILLFAAYFGVLRLIAGGPLALEGQGPAFGARPPATGISIERGKRLLWVGSLEGGTAGGALSHDVVARNVVAADFSAAFPRLAFAQEASYDPLAGIIRLAGADWQVFPEHSTMGPLIPELSQLPQSRIWDRLRVLDRSSIPQALAAAGGFLLFLIGFRFLARLSRWPLASAFLAAAGFVGAIMADSYLGSPGAERLVHGFAGGGALPFVWLVAAFEGGMGLLMSAVDLLVTPRRRGES